MKKSYIKGLFLVSSILLVGCSNKKSETVETSNSNQATESSTKVSSTTMISTTNTEEKTTSSEKTSSTTVSSNEQPVQNESIEPVLQETYSEPEPVEQEENYEDLKQRTLTSTPADRENWSNKEWEAFGMALYENGLVLDDVGNIISQQEYDQQYNQEVVLEEPTNLTDFVNKYGMSPAAYKMQYEGMSEEEALRNTPNEMKTSGEIQLGFSKYGIQ